MDIRVARGRYRLDRILGRGSFGEVYVGVHIETGAQVAVKLEANTERYPQLEHEYKVYETLAGTHGVPGVHWLGREGDYVVMVMDLLGASLEDLHVRHDHQFSLKTVLMLGIQLIARLKTLHARNLVHRDVKPDNCLMGRGATESVVHLIDYGLSKLYWKHGQHVPFRNGKTLTGSARYASVNAHLGYEQSRRDDMESLGYVLIFLLHGRLPWQGLVATSKADRYAKIAEHKRTLPLPELCRDAAPFIDYFTHIRALRFEQAPNYKYLSDLLLAELARNGWTEDGVFDWSA